MTGKEKLIETLTDKIDSLAYTVCPSDFKLNDDCDLGACSECWIQALEKEYPDES